jgi:signal transduction histidine kinase
MSSVAGGAGPSQPPFLYRLGDRGWVVVDTLLALVALVLALATSGGRSGVSHEAPRGVLAVVLVVVATLPVMVRRRFPRAAFALVTVAVAVLTARGQAPLVVAVMLGAVVYTIALRFERRTSVPALAALLAVGIAAAVAAADHVGALHGLVLAGAAWFVGDGVQARRRYLKALAAQAVEQRRLEVERGRRAVGDERVRIARELHDVVAHSLGVITVQAGVGRRVIDAQPQEARKALAAIEVTGRAASDELRRILGLLRDDDLEPPSLSPAPGLNDVPTLVANLREAGVPVELSASGASELPEAVGVSVYRIVQEALTNVVKHAGAVPTRVTIGVQPDGVRVEVINDGQTSASSANASARRMTAVGHGIVGMRERVSAFGGSLLVEPRRQGGFQVLAFLPVPRQEP